MKIALYSDNLHTVAGSAKVDILLANYLGADIITAGYNKEIEKFVKIKGNVIDLGNISLHVNKSLGFYFETPLRFLFYRNSTYDINIFTGTSSIFASQKNKKNIWFCYSPNRLLYDLRDWKLASSGLINKFFFKLHIFLFSSLDQRVVKHNFTAIVAQTKGVQKRIEKYYKLKSEVIYSPIESSKYKFNEFGDYFLTVSRFTPEKRVDLIIKAFIEMTDKRLIVVGDGVKKRELLRLINKSPNITIISNITEKQLKELYANCFATLYFPKQEDFGLVPLEGMASGKICIAVNEGGCRETIKHGENGFLLNPDINEIISIVKNLDKNTVKKLKVHCLKSVKKFDIKDVIIKWETLINNI